MKLVLICKIQFCVYLFLTVEAKGTPYKWHSTPYAVRPNESVEALSSTAATVLHSDFPIQQQVWEYFSKRKTIHIHMKKLEAKSITVVLVNN